MVSKKFNVFTKLIIGLLGLSFIILVHEFGHFIFCKFFHVRTPVFSIGFGPELISYTFKRTKFQISALPLGGYVSINQHDLDNLTYVKQILILMAGVLFNFLLSLSIFSYLYYENNLEHKSLFHRITPEKVKQIWRQNQEASFVGPIGIMSMIGQSLELGVDAFIYFIAIISFNIGLFNLLPVPFFDGGQILLLTLEKISKINLQNYNIANYIYYILLILIVLFSIILLIRDIKRLNK